MLAVNYTTMRNKLKDYCDLVSDYGETIIVTRKADRNVVVLSLDRYNAMEKELRNAKYLEKINRAFNQLYAGKGKAPEIRTNIQNPLIFCEKWLLLNICACHKGHIISVSLNFQHK